MSIYEEIQKLLSSSGAHYREMIHAAVGQSDAVSAERGTSLQQGAKAMLICVDKKSYYLLVLPANRMVDLDAIATLLNVSRKKISFAQKTRAEEITECVSGAIPPFRFNDKFGLIVDPTLFDNSEIAFNAGRLDRSILLNTADYKKIAEEQGAQVKNISLAREVETALEGDVEPRCAPSMRM